MMKVLLISANTEKINMPTLPMGLGLVAAAAARAGHRVDFLDLMAEDAPQEALALRIRDVAPEVIGISIRNVDDQDSAAPRFLLEAARALVADCKSLSDAPVVLGGAGYSLFPQSALAYLGGDMGIQGEGEGAFTALLDQLERGGRSPDVPGLYLRGRGRRSRRIFHSRIDDWPMPDPELFDVDRFRDPAYYLPVQTRRGCPLNCSYCATGTIEGRRIRRRSPQRLVADLSRWRSAGFERVFFVDNTFNLPPGYAQALCRQLIQADLGLTWRCILYPGRVPAGLISAMAEAGCTEVSLGFESGNRCVLAGMGKHFSPEEAAVTARRLGDAGIRRMGFLLLGGPDETLESAAESLAWVDSLGLEMVKVTVGIRIYPGTRLAAIAAGQGVVDPADDLLRPVFYLKPGLENALRQQVDRWLADRPSWIY